MKLFCCSLLIFEKANNRGKVGREEEVWCWNFTALFGSGKVKRASLTGCEGTDTDQKSAKAQTEAR
jgi:hypothetical protein